MSFRTEDALNNHLDSWNNIGRTFHHDEYHHDFQFDD